MCCSPLFSQNFLQTCQINPWIHTRGLEVLPGHSGTLREIMWSRRHHTHNSEAVLPAMLSWLTPATSPLYPACFFPVLSCVAGNWAEVAGPGKRHHHSAGNSQNKQALVPITASPGAALPRNSLYLQAGAHQQIPLRQPMSSSLVLEKDK